MNRLGLKIKTNIVIIIFNRDNVEGTMDTTFIAKYTLIIYLLI